MEHVLVDKTHKLAILSKKRIGIYLHKLSVVAEYIASNDEEFLVIFGSTSDVDKEICKYKPQGE